MPTNSIPQTFPNVDSILTGCCPVCGYDLTIDTEPAEDGDHFFVLCSHYREGRRHLRVAISLELALEYDEVVNWMDVAQGAHEEELAFGRS